jgi:sporulation protein YlmC with PRC-barrel domain
VADHLDLIRDVLDKQMVDRHGRRCGKVDGLVLVIGAGQPRVVGLQVGGGTLARRISVRLGRWAASWARRLGIRDGQPYRIPWSRVVSVDLEVALDLDARRSNLDAAERVLRERLVGKIPGA